MTTEQKLREALQRVGWCLDNQEPLSAKPQTSDEWALGETPLTAPPAATVPDGWQLVPKIATQEMLDKACTGGWAIKNLKHYGISYEEIFGLFQETYEIMLAAAPQSGKKEEWISVKERLPELTGRDDSHVPGDAPATLYSDRVLVFDGTVRIDNLIQAEGDPGTTTFYVGTDEPITYWMPLPSPPSKAEGEP